MAIIGIDLGTSHSARADQLKEVLQEVGKKLYEQAVTKVPPARPKVGVYQVIVTVRLNLQTQIRLTCTQGAKNLSHPSVNCCRIPTMTRTCSCRMGCTIDSVKSAYFRNFEKYTASFLRTERKQGGFLYLTMGRLRHRWCYDNTLSRRFVCLSAIV